jgi:uncharacterized protein YjeT (DUF2065 family)
MPKNLKKAIEFLMLAAAIVLLTVGILKFALPKYFGSPSYLYLIGAGLVYLLQRNFKRRGI